MTWVASGVTDAVAHAALPRYHHEQTARSTAHLLLWSCDAEIISRLHALYSQIRWRYRILLFSSNRSSPIPLRMWVDISVRHVHDKWGMTSSWRYIIGCWDWYVAQACSAGPATDQLIYRFVTCCVIVPSCCVIFTSRMSTDVQTTGCALSRRGHAASFSVSSASFAVFFVYQVTPKN